MKACLLNAPARIETNPLQFTDVPVPQPAKGEVLIRVRACGVCRTDLHVIEGELPPKKSPVIPGHQVVGIVEKLGEGSRRFALGARVGVAWLHHTDGVCMYCRMGEENLCDNPTFTGYSVDGGYAEYAVAPEDFIYAIPRWISGRAGRASALRGNHRIPVLATFGDQARRATGILWFWRGGTRGDSGGAALGRDRVCLDARCAASETGA